MTAGWRMTGLVCGLGVAGCGVAGPEVRLAPDPAEWRPARVLVLPVTLASGAVSANRALPAGLTAPTAESAMAEVRAALVATLATCATICSVGPAPELTRSGTAEAVVRISRQYLDTRQTDPEAGRAAAAGWDGDSPENPSGLLLVAVLKYGPEVDEDVSSMSKSVSTTVGTTDVGISSSAQRIVAYLNVHVRCALIRGHDGVMIWDASARRRVKSAAAGEAGLPGLLAQAAADLCLGWPWRPGSAPGEPGEASPDEDEPAAASARPAPATSDAPPAGPVALPAGAAQPSSGGTPASQAAPAGPDPSGGTSAVTLTPAPDSPASATAFSIPVR